MSSKGKILTVGVLVVVLCIGGFMFFKNGGSKEEKYEKAILEQLDLVPIEADESDGSESYIDLGDESSMIEAQKVVSERLEIHVEEIKDSSMILLIKNADLSKIVEKDSDLNKIMERLKSEDCPMKETKVEVNYKDEDGTPVIEKNAELFDAVFGGLPSAYGLGGNEG